jgi:hypothetical protein
MSRRLSGQVAGHQAEQLVDRHEQIEPPADLAPNPMPGDKVTVPGDQRGSTRTATVVAVDVSGSQTGASMRVDLEQLDG